MNFVDIEIADGLALLTLSRGKVNALNPEVVAELREAFRKVEQDANVRAVVLTGRGKFFSFGFDIPEFLGYSKERFRDYLVDFTALYAEIFFCSKPVVAALNGHAIAGGCMIAIACDRRVMSSGKAKIALNEITFGSGVFAGCTEILRSLVGNRVASEILDSGRMYFGSEAKTIGLVDDVVAENDVVAEASRVAREIGAAAQPAFSNVKQMLRAPVAEEIRRREEQSIDAFIDIWYSPATWAQLQAIRIQEKR